MPSAPVPAPRHPSPSLQQNARHTVRAATGPMGLAEGVTRIVLPAEHPGGHGSLQLELTIEDGVIVAADPIIGSVHRGVEKLFEVRDYRQILALANRHDWLAGFAGELGVALVVEEALGMRVPERATWLRMVLAELSRLHSHLVFLGSAPHPEDPRRPIADTRPLVDALTTLLDDFSGTRMHPMVTAIGGLRMDTPAGWEDAARHTLAWVRESVPAHLSPFDETVVTQRHTGLGVLSPAAAAGFGASGPVGRASGLTLDARVVEPYLGYAACPPRVVTDTIGDARARWAVIRGEIAATLDLLDACLAGLDRLGPGPVSMRLPKVVRVPEGEWYAVTETPLGASGVFLVSRGAKTPARLALRTPSWGNVSALAAMLPGTPAGAIGDVVASVPFVMGDVDK